MLPVMLSREARGGPLSRQLLRTGAVTPSLSCRFRVSTGGASTSAAGAEPACAQARTRASRATRRIGTAYAMRRAFKKRVGRRPARARPTSSLLASSGGFLEISQVAAEEVPRALLHLPHALAGETPFLAQLLQRARIVLRQTVAEDVPGELAHALAHLAERVADVLVLLRPHQLRIGSGAFVGQPVEVRRVAVAVGAQRLLEGDVARREPAVGHGPAHRGGAVLPAARDVRAD